MAKPTISDAEFDKLWGDSTPAKPVDDAEFDRMWAATPATEPERSPNTPRTLTTTGMTNAGLAASSTARSVALQSGATPDQALEAARRAGETARVIGPEANSEEVRETLASTDPLDRALGRRVVSAPMVEPANRDAEYREMVDTVDLQRAFAGETPEPVSLGENQRVWMDRGKALATRQLAGMATAGLAPIVDYARRAMGEESWFAGAPETPSELGDLLTDYGSDRGVQRLAGMGANLLEPTPLWAIRKMQSLGNAPVEGGGKDLARAAIGIVSKTPLPAVASAIRETTGMDEGQTALMWDDANPREAFDRAAEGFYAGEGRDAIDIMPYRDLPARLRGADIDVERFKRAAESDDSLASIRGLNSDASIEAAIMQLPTSVVNQYAPGALPTDDEISDTVKRRHRAKDWSGADLWADLEPLMAAGLMRPIDNGKDAMYVPSRFQEVFRYLGVPWAAVVVEPDVNPFQLMAPGWSPDPVEQGDTSLLAKARALRVPTVRGSETMIASGAYNDWLETFGLRGGESYADLARPESTWYSRTLADFAMPDYGMRGWADVFERAGGDPNSAAAKTLGTADVLAQFVLPAEALVTAPLGAALRGGAVARSSRRALMELGVPARESTKVALKTFVSSDPLAMVGQSIKDELETQMRSGRFNPDDVTPTARRQLKDVLQTAGVDDADATTDRLLEDLRDRRARVLDVNGEMNVLGGPQTRALRESTAYRDVRRDMELLTSGGKTRMSPADVDANMRYQEAMALNAWDNNEVATPEEWFERQMWQVGVEAETLPAGTLFQKDPPAPKIKLSSRQALEQLQKQGTISDRQVAQILGDGRPEYLDAVMSFILEQRQKVLDGRLTNRDVAKAYVTSVASQRAGEINPVGLTEGWRRVTPEDGGPPVKIPIGNQIDLDAAGRMAGERRAAAGGSADPVRFTDTNTRGGTTVRPEETMAAWFFTNDGQRALDAIERGEFDAEAWERGALLRDAFGANTLRNEQSAGVFAVPEGDEITLRNISDLTKAINDAHGDPTKIAQAVGRLKGIGEAKTPFVSQLLGFGEAPTVDAIEINGWLTGKSAATTPESRALVDGIKRNYGGGTPGGQSAAAQITRTLRDRIAGGFSALRDAGHAGTADIAPEAFGAIMHHWFWDKLKQAETTHEGLYAAQRYASEVDGVLRGSISPNQTGSPEFAAFFEESKVVDPNGDPLVVYHGTDSDFTEFRDGPTYFSPDRKSPYLRQANAVVPAYVSLKNPLYTSDTRLVMDLRTKPDVVQDLKNQGYDGIVYADPADLTKPSKSGNAPEIVSFYPSQVKSAVGNVGTFDPANPNILYSVEGGKVAGSIEAVAPDSFDAGAAHYIRRRDELYAQGNDPVRTGGIIRRELPRLTKDMTPFQKGVHAAMNRQVDAAPLVAARAEVATANPVIDAATANYAARSAEWSNEIKAIVASGGDPWAWDARTKYPKLDDAVVKMDEAAAELRRAKQTLFSVEDGRVAGSISRAIDKNIPSEVREAAGTGKFYTVNGRGTWSDIAYNTEEEAIAAVREASGLEDVLVKRANPQRLVMAVPNPPPNTAFGVADATYQSSLGRLRSSVPAAELDAVAGEGAMDRLGSALRYAKNNENQIPITSEALQNASIIARKQAESSSAREAWLAFARDVEQAEDAFSARTAPAAVEVAPPPVVERPGLRLVGEDDILYSVEGGKVAGSIQQAGKEPVDVGFLNVESETAAPLPEEASTGRVLRRSPGNLLPAEKEVFDAFIKERPDGNILLEKLEEHKGTPWANQAVEGVFVRKALDYILRGEEPPFESSLNSKNVSGKRRRMFGGGSEAVFRELDAEGLMGGASKPVNTVNSSFINCTPSTSCAKYCYATKGNYRYAGSIVKSELITLAIELDPVRTAKTIAREYKGTLEFAQNKALRLFDKGDGTDAWIPAIKELNRQGVRVQIFSKNPSFLREVPEMNLRMLSVDDTNLALADANPDLKVAFVYSGPEQNATLKTLEARNQVQVVLPVKIGQSVMTASEIAPLRREVPGVSKYLCPIDSGIKKIGTKPGTWNCTKCDKNGGIGCFFGNPTEAVLASKEVAPARLPSDRVQRITDLQQRIRDVQRLRGTGADVALTGRGGPGGGAGLLSEVDALLAELLRDLDPGGEGAAGRGVPRADAPVRGPVQDDPIGRLTSTVDAARNVGTFDPTNPNILYSVENGQVAGSIQRAPTVNPQGFYSGLRRAVADMKGERFSADQLRATLKNTPGVKAAEIEWTGLDSFLADNPKPTKAEVLDWLDENAVVVEERVLGATAEEVERSAAARAKSPALEEEAERLDAQIRNLSDFDKTSPDAEALEQYGEGWNALTSEVQAARAKMDAERPYTVPYKEAKDKVDFIEERMNVLHREMVFDTIERNTPKANQLIMERDGIRSELVDLWNQTGVAAPIQYGSYQLSNGTNPREVLFKVPDTETPKAKAAAETFKAAMMEKYNSNPGDYIPWYERISDEEGAQWDGITSRLNDLGRKGPAYEAPHYGSEGENLLAHTRLADHTGPNGEKLLLVNEIQADSAQRLRELQIKADAGKITEAERVELNQLRAFVGPFADTDKWVGYVMKRILRMAAEGGYDGVTWTTGAQQVKRYENATRQVVDAVQWRRAGNEIELVGQKGDRETYRETMPSEKVGDVLGKGMAAKIVNDPAPSGTLAGADLTIGGEGMKGFYDSILRSWADKYGKKWGAKSGTTTIQTEGVANEAEWMPRRDSAAFETFDRQTWAELEPFERDIVDSNLNIKKGPTATPVHYLPIPDNMRQSIMNEGQPLFSRTNGVTRGAISPDGTRGTGTAPNPARAEWEARGRAAADRVAELERAAPAEIPNPEWAKWDAARTSAPDELTTLQQRKGALQQNPRPDDPEWATELEDVNDRIVELSKTATQAEGVPAALIAAGPSTTAVQKYGGIGYNRASILVDEVKAGRMTWEQALTTARREGPFASPTRAATAPEPARTIPAPPSPELVAARAELEALRGQRVPRTVPGPGLTKWLIRLFQTGDFSTALHEGGHLMALMRPAWEAKAAKVFDSVGGRLTIVGHEALAEAMARIGRGVFRPGRIKDRLAMDVLDVIGDLWGRVRDLPIVEKLPDRLLRAADRLPKPITLEQRKLLDNTFRPSERSLPAAVKIVDERQGRQLPPRVTVTGTNEGDINAGPVQRAGKARYATDVDRNAAELRQALGLKAGEQEVDPITLLAEAMAYIGTERVRRQWGVGGLMTLPSGRTAVPKERHEGVLAEAERHRRATLGFTPGPELVFNADQQAGLRRLLGEINDSPLGEFLPERLRDVTSTGSDGITLATLTQDEWNAVVGAHTDLYAGRGAFREKRAELASQSGAIRLLDNVVESARRTDLKPTIDAAMRAFNSTMVADETLQPAQREMLKVMVRDLAGTDAEVRRAVLAVGRDLRQGKKDFRAPDLIAKVAKAIPPEVVPVSALGDLAALEGLLVNPSLDKTAPLVDDIHKFFVEAPLWATANEQSARELEALGILARADLDDPRTADAMAIVHEGLRRRQESVLSTGRDIALHFAGTDEATIASSIPNIAERNSMYKRQYQSWYEGRWDENLLDMVGQGRAAAGQKYDQGDAALGVLLRLAVRRKLGEFARRMAESGIAGDVMDVAKGGAAYNQPYTIGGYANRSSPLVQQYIDNVAGYISAESGWQTTGRLEEGGTPYGAAPVNRVGLDMYGANFDPIAYAEARRQMSRWGFEPGQNTDAWSQIDLPGGGKVIAPDVFMENLRAAMDEVAPTSMGYGARLSGDPRLGEITKGASLVNKPGPGTEAVNFAIRSLSRTAGFSFGMLKKGMLTGIGPLIRPSYYIGNILGGFNALHQSLGVRGMLRVGTAPLRTGPDGKLIRSVIKRLYQDVAGNPGPSVGFFTRDGRYITDTMVADSVTRRGISSSLASSEFKSSLVADIKAEEPTTWNNINRKMIPGTKAWAKMMDDGATAVDNYFRIGTYVDGLKRGVSEEEAARLAREVAFDYNDLTEFERKVARKAILFYAFQRRNQDLFWRTLLNNPERLAAEIRLLSGMQRENLGEDSELYVSPFDEGRMVAMFREPLEDGHLKNAQRGAMTLLPAMNVGSQVGLWVDLLGALSSAVTDAEYDAPSMSGLFGVLDPRIQTAIAMAGTDPETGRPLADTRKKIPDNIVAADQMISGMFADMDDEISGGMLVRDIFGARPVQPWDDIEAAMPGANVWEVDRTNPGAVRAWYAFQNLVALTPMANTAQQIDRFVPGGLADPRVGVTEAEEFAGWLGARTSPVQRREVVLGRDIRAREAELTRQEKEMAAGSVVSGRGR